MTRISHEDFPNSFAEPFTITSPANGRYNCIGWALEDVTHFYWPLSNPYLNWPSDIPRRPVIKTFIRLFQKHSYEPCEDGILEPGFQKIALFALGKQPTHAARQLPNGLWTSKLGADVDIEHTLPSMQGGRYGAVVRFFKRKIQWKADVALLG